MLHSVAFRGRFSTAISPHMKNGSVRAFRKDTTSACQAAKQTTYPSLSTSIHILRSVR